MTMPIKMGESGMTLIELTIVMVIIGLLAALVIPQFRGVVDDAKLKTAQSEIQVFEGALQRYSIDVGDYPTSEQGLRALWQDSNLVSGNWRGPYVSKPKFRDPWGNEYIYRYPGNHQGYDYDLYSLGKDGKEGGDPPFNADITNWIELAE